MKTKKILLIDDEDMVINVAKAMLNHLDCDVITATNGQEGIETFKTNQDDIDLIILDYNMPDMNGFQCLDEIRTYSQEVPILLSSGVGVNFSNNELSDRPLQGVLTKPFTLDQMQEKLKTLIHDM